MAGLLTTALTCATGVTATFAWFSLEPFHREKVVNFKVADDAQAFLYMAEGKDTYVDSETGNLRIKKDAEISPKIPKTLDPVTGAGSTIKDGRPVLKTAPRMRAEDGDASPDTYLTLEYYFECDHDCWLTLAPESKITPREEANASKTDPDDGHPLNPADLNNAVHALRTRFNGTERDGSPIDITAVPTPKNSQGVEMKRNPDKMDTYYGGIADMMPFNGFYDSYADGEGKKEYCYGVGDQTLVPYLNETGSASEGQKGDFLHAAHENGVQLVDVEKAKQDGLIKKEEALDFSSIILNDGEGQIPAGGYLLDLKANVAKKLTITVYIEGWDPYCTNSIGQASMELNLVFTGLAH